jgi:tetratricopeptide (TPR) repeat protein
MKMSLILSIVLIQGVVRAEAWTPPEKPDPQAIMREAKADARAGKYDVALAKQEWFYEHALEFQPSLSGVRLSFALGNWFDLAKEYQPAMAKLMEVRDEARQRVAEEDDPKALFNDFHDLASINRVLGEENLTAEAFREVHQRDPEGAARIFNVAEPALIRAKEYKLCGEYIDTDKSLRRITEHYRRMREFEERSKQDRPIPKFAEPRFLNEAATLVALLVVNDRQDEAERAVVELKKEKGDAAFHAKLAEELEKALKGTVPKPWP